MTAADGASDRAALSTCCLSLSPSPTPRLPLPPPHRRFERRRQQEQPPSPTPAVLPAVGVGGGRQRQGRYVWSCRCCGLWCPTSRLPPSASSSLMVCIQACMRVLPAYRMYAGMDACFACVWYLPWLPFTLTLTLALALTLTLTLNTTPRQSANAPRVETRRR